MCILHLSYIYPTPSILYYPISSFLFYILYLVFCFYPAFIQHLSSYPRTEDIDRQNLKLKYLNNFSINCIEPVCPVFFCIYLDTQVRQSVLLQGRYHHHHHQDQGHQSLRLLLAGEGGGAEALKHWELQWFWVFGFTNIFHCYSIREWWDAVLQKWRAWALFYFFCCYLPSCVVSQQLFLGIFCFINFPHFTPPPPPGQCHVSSTPSRRRAEHLLSDHVSNDATHVCASRHPHPPLTRRTWTKVGACSLQAHDNILLVSSIAVFCRKYNKVFFCFINFHTYY